MTDTSEIGQVKHKMSDSDRICLNVDLGGHLFHCFKLICDMCRPIATDIGKVHPKDIFIYLALEREGY